jgi:hypothetical protein
MSELVTEEDLARARSDPVFRQRFYADHLDRLLERLNEMRKAGADQPERARLIKEGVDLAVKLADRLNTKANMAKNSSGRAA